MVNKKAGFTLIELLLVIVIIIILTGIAIPVSANYINGRQLYNAATQIQQDLLLVQNLAITHSTDPSANPSDASKRKFEVYFYPSANTYYFEAEENSVFNSPSSMSGKVITRKFSSSIKVEGVSEGWHIAFDNQGIPYPAGGTIEISLGNKKLKVVISPIGRVTVE